MRQEKELVISLALICLQPSLDLVHLAIFGPLGNLLARPSKLFDHESHGLSLHVCSSLEMASEPAQIAIELLFGILESDLGGDGQLPVVVLSCCFYHGCAC